MNLSIFNPSVWQIDETVQCRRKIQDKADSGDPCSPKASANGCFPLAPIRLPEYAEPSLSSSINELKDCAGPRGTEEAAAARP
jgi:hypothetical protein